MCNCKVWLRGARVPAVSAAMITMVLCTAALNSKITATNAINNTSTCIFVLLFLMFTC